MEYHHTPMLYRAFPFPAKGTPLTGNRSAAMFNISSFAALTHCSFSVELPDIYSPFHHVAFDFV